MVDARQRVEFGCLTVAVRDGAGLVEQQRGHVAGRFDGTARRGEHVALDQTVHAGDADGAQQRADGRRDQADEQRHQHGEADGGADRAGLRVEAHHDDQEDNGQRAQQHVEGDFVRGLLTVRAFDQRDHLVDEGFARLLGDAHDDAVGQHAGAAGHRGAVAAGFADDRGGFAGDGGFIHGGDAGDDVAVAGDKLSGFDDDHVAEFEVGGRDFDDGDGQRACVRIAFFIVSVDQVGRRGGAGLAQRVGLSLAAPFSDGFGEVREQHRGPQAHGDDPGEIHRLARAQFRNEQLEHSEERQECGAHPYHEHDGVVPHLGGTEFPERRRQTLAQHRRQRCVVAGTHVVDDVVCGRGRHVMPPNLLPTVPEQASGRTSARK